jgi:hypothetical protein
VSNRLAIAAVTASLRNLLAGALAVDDDLSDAVVTAQPLDKARDSAATSNQINVFLYMISPNAAWRNQDLPGRTRSGEVAAPPLALNLFYLVSAYGRDNDAQMPFSQLLLGQAMSVLYDHPLLGRDEVNASLPGSDLGDQFERLRITLQPLSLEEISKLWAGFQMQYRLSVAYEVAVVLIDPSTPVRAAPPVVSRGADGTGFPAGVDPVNAFPQIAAFTPNRALRPGETITILGTGLAGQPASVLLAPWRGGAPILVAASPLGVGQGFTAVLPGDGTLPAGPCMLSLQVGAAGQSQTSNELALMVAPRVTSVMPAKLSLGADGGAAVLSLNVDPPVLASQRAALILGSREIIAETRTGTVTTLAFALAGTAVGTYLARVRVDGADSIVFVDPDAAVPQYDPAQTIEVAA